MSLALEKSPLFEADLTAQFVWYAERGGTDLAWRFFAAVESTVTQLAGQPELGRLRSFPNPNLQGLRSFRVEPPFDQWVVFYRATPVTVQIWRLMHGARDLPRRLRGG